PPAGVAACKRATGYGRDAHKKAAYGQKHRSLQAASPQGAPCPRQGCRGSASPQTGGAHRGRRRLHRGSGNDGGGQRGQDG
ncbi:hypothetical protein GW17_00026567, partial [Ensete ventricosum]